MWGVITSKLIAATVADDCASIQTRRQKRSGLNALATETSGRRTIDVHRRDLPASVMLTMMRLIGSVCHTTARRAAVCGHEGVGRASQGRMVLCGRYIADNNGERSVDGAGALQTNLIGVVARPHSDGVGRRRSREGIRPALRPNAHGGLVGAVR